MRHVSKNSESHSSGCVNACGCLEHCSDQSIPRRYKMKNTSSPKGVNRRTFLKTSSVGTAAIVIGLTSSWETKATVQQGQQPKSINPFPAWIRIEENGKVTLMAPRPDMGEGTLTSLPMIVAEELEVEWSSVTVEPAPVNQRLYRPQSLTRLPSLPRSRHILHQI